MLRFNQRYRPFGRPNPLIHRGVTRSPQVRTAAPWSRLRPVSPHPPRPSPRARAAQALRRATGALSTAATARMDDDMAWFRELERRGPLLGRSDRPGRHPQLRRLVPPPRRHLPRRATPLAASVFGAAPRALAGVITLQQTVDLIRLSIEVVERNIDEIVDPDDAPDVHAAVLRYAREVAFATAEVYARAAEVARRLGRPARGAGRRRRAPRRGRRGGPVPGQRAGLDRPRRRRRRARRGAGPAYRRPTSSTRYDARPRAAGLDALCGTQGERLVVVLGGVTDLRSRGRRRRRALRRGAGRRRARASTTSAAPTSRPARRSRPTARPPGWPDAPRPVRSDELLPERALAGDGHARRHLVDEVYLPLLRARATLIETLAAYFAHRRLDRGRRPGALRAPQHRALPAATGRRAHRLQPRRPPRRVHPADRAGAGPPVRPHRRPRRRLIFVGTLQRLAAPDSCAPEVSPGPRLGTVEACSSSSLPAREPRPPASSRPGSRTRTFASRLEWLSTVAGLDLAHYGTEADAETIRDTADRPAAAGRHRPGRRARAVPPPRRRLRRIGAVAGHSVGELAAAAGARVITAEQAMVLVRERGRAMAAASAATPTGMTAVLGGDRDEVLATLDKHGLTPANDNGPGQVVAAGTLEQLAGARRRAAGQGPADPAQRRRRLPHRAHGARRRPPRHAWPARSRPTTRAPR